jgi:hypothetical protein
LPMVSRDWPIWARYVTMTAFVVLVGCAIAQQQTAAREKMDVGASTTTRLNPIGQKVPIALLNRDDAAGPPRETRRKNLPSGDPKFGTSATPKRIRL